MTVAFMALFSAVIQDRVSERLGRTLLWPLVIVGVATIAWWYWSELAGHGDLRPYAVVQFLPMLLIPLMLLLFRGRGLRDAWLWATLAAYVLAKGADWAADAIVGRDVVEASGGIVVRVTMEEGYSTSSIIRKIRRGL